MERIIKIVFISFMLSMPICLYAQQRQLEMTYDKAGNRTSMKIVLLSSQNAPQQSRTRATGNEKTEYTNDWLGTNEIHIYPNPTKGILRIALSGRTLDKTILIRLYTDNGSLLIQQDWDGQEIAVDLSDYPSGIYILSMLKDGISKKFKVIKE